MKLVFATNNLNKLSEIKDLVPDNIKILSLKDINCNEELLETSLTIEGNAIQKAQYVAEKYGFSCFADDTGLEIDVLNGDPGVFSARYAGNECNAEDNIQRVLESLSNKNNRAAQFRTVIALVMNSKQYLFEGVCKGKISKVRKGILGFGYDPIFIPQQYNRTFAEMTKHEKGLVSHRGRAVARLVEFLTIN